MGRQHCCLPNFILKGKTKMTKEELIAKIDFNVDHEQVQQIALQQHKSAANKSNRKEKNIHIYDTNDFPCNNATTAYVLMKFSIKNMFFKNLNDYKEKPNLAEILYETCQAVLINKSNSKFRPPGYDMSVDVLLADIICEELFNEISNDYDDIFEINKL